MSLRIKPVIAIAMILVLCHAALDRGEAKVVRSDKNGPVNSPVEVGGQRPATPSSGKIAPPPVYYPPLAYYPPPPVYYAPPLYYGYYAPPGYYIMR